MAAMIEGLIGRFFLLVGHGGIQAGEGGGKLLDPVRVGLRDIGIGLQIVDRRRARSACGALVDRSIHLLGVIAHRCRDFIPLSFLGRGDLERGVKLVDVFFDRSIALGIRIRRVVEPDVAAEARGLDDDGSEVCAMALPNTNVDTRTAAITFIKVSMGDMRSCEAFEQGSSESHRYLTITIT